MDMYYVYRLAASIAPFIPRRVGYGMVSLVAQVLYRASASTRAMILANQWHIAGPHAPPALVEGRTRRVFTNLLKNYFDLFWLPGQPDRVIQRLVAIHGLQHVDQALARGKGLVLVTAHYGNQELMTRAHSFAQRYRITGVAEHVANERVFRLFCRLRQSQTITLVPSDGSMMPLVRALRRNEIVALAVDWDVTGTGCIVSLLGRPARLATGPVVLARRTGAALIPAFVVRQPDDSFDVFIEPEIPVQRTGDAEADLEENMRRVAAILGQYLQRYPEQWTFFHYLWEDDKNAHRAS